jgi:hypothetical protein
MRAIGGGRTSGGLCEWVYGMLVCGGPQDRMCTYLGCLQRVPGEAPAVHEEGVFVALPQFRFGNVLTLHHHRIPRLKDSLDQPLFPIVVDLTIQLRQTRLGLLDSRGGAP